MQAFFETYTFILAFLIAVLLLATFAPENVTTAFLFLVLLSMVLGNSDKMKSFLGVK